MPRLIGRIGTHPEFYEFSDPRLEREGFLSLYSCQVAGFRHRLEMLDRGHAVVVLPVDFARRTVVMIEQPRCILAMDGHPSGRHFLQLAKAPRTATSIRSLSVPAGVVLVLECPAGMIDEGETPIQAAVRETREETGFDVPQERFIEVLSTCHPSVGGSTERFSLYFADISAPVKRVEPRGDGDEQIAIWELTFDELFERFTQKRLASASANILVGDLERQELKKRLETLERRFDARE